MANNGGEKKKSDFYGVMGLKKECTALELRNAYKKLALRWHPDRCSASGNLKFVEEAKKKFQNIQEAYSVLSDDNKRFMYDVGVYDNDDDDDENGMGDFLNEMVVMMSQTDSNDTVNRSFKDLQTLFEEMFQDDIDDSFGFGSQKAKSSNGCSSASATTASPTSYQSYFEGHDSNHKRNMSEMSCGSGGVDDSNGFGSHYQGFCLGTGGAGSREGGDGKRRNSRRARR